MSVTETPAVAKRPDKTKCNTCGGRLGTLQAPYQTLKNQRWLATIIDGVVVQECCEHCAIEAEDMAEAKQA